MRSATSYFNGPLYRKTMARFWPLWGLWGVGWLFLIPLNFLNIYFNRYVSTAPQRRLMDMAANLPDLLESGVVLALFFAILCAMAVFGYLYNHRSACWFHALPMRREALFTTQYLAGLSMMLLPLLAVAVLTAVIEISFLPMNNWGAALSGLGAWLLAQCGICLFFFSFAAFCAMFTGNILALPAFYGILNGLAAGLWLLVDALMNEFYYGYAGMPGALTVVEYLTPAEILTRAVYWFSGTPAEPAHLSSPGTVAAYAAVGVALALFSLYVYRRRHVETAGDVVAVAVVRPLFKYGVSFCSGLAFGMFTAAFFPEHPALVMICLYAGGMAVGVLCGLVLKNTAFHGKPVPFVMELPNYRLPGPKNVALLLWDKAKDFLTRAFTVIFLATIVIWFLQTFDTRLNVVAAGGEASMLAGIGRLIAPVFTPLGFSDWRASTALITGFSAKEAVVSTLAVLTGTNTATLPAALAQIFTPAAAVAFLTFTLLYTPCVAAIAAVRRELGGRYAVTMAAGQCLIAWAAAFLVYHAARLIF